MTETKLAMITGAGSGMGRATAQVLAADGWSLLLCDIKAESLAETRSLLDRPDRAEILPCDLTAPDLAATLEAALGGRKLNAVVNSAGLSNTMAPPDRIIAVNLGGSIALVDMVRPLMAKGGVAVLIASFAGHQFGAGMDAMVDAAVDSGDLAPILAFATTPELAYSISKRGVLRLVRRRALEYGRAGLRILSLSPGIIDTPMAQAEMARYPVMQKMIEGSPLGRAARPEEVGTVVRFMCSDDSSFMTGTDLLVDGGEFAVA